MNFLKRIDEYFFNQIDSLKNNESIQTIYYYLDELNDFQIKLIKIVLTFIFFSLPFFLVFYFFYENYTIKNEISLKKDLYYSLTEIVGKRNNLGDLTRINKKPLSDIDSLQDYLRSFSAEKGYTPVIEDFKREDMTKNFKKIDVKIKFSKIDSKIFFDLITYLKNDIGFLIKKIECNKTEDLLEGSLELVSFGL